MPHYRRLEPIRGSTRLGSELAGAGGTLDPPRAGGAKSLPLQSLKIFAAGFVVASFCRGGSIDAGLFETACRHNLLLNFLGALRVLFEELAGLFLALAKLHFAVTEPGARAGDDLGFHPQIKDVPFIADAVGVHHVELSDAERRRHF